MEKKPFLPFTSTATSILIHGVAWLCVCFIPFLFFSVQINLSFFLLRILFPNLMLAAFFYANMFLLMPRFLKTRKHWPYILSIVSIICVITVFDLLLEDHLFRTYLRSGLPPNVYISAPLTKTQADSLPKSARIGLIRPPSANVRPTPGELAPASWPSTGVRIGIGRFGIFRFGFSRSLLLSVLALAISSSLKVTSEWFKNENQKKEMENDKLSSELLFLKSQVNPHFFFNTLNNIYSLANSKSDDAPVAIAKLSQLMRYMLYESNVSLVPLSRELEYLHSYIDLQRLRFRDNIKIDFSIEGEVDDKMIEPMLFIPFVENAFKHGPGLQQNPSITIILRTSNHQLYFSVANTFEKNGNGYKDNSSGIGLQNIKRRLDLLYPNTHELIVNEANSVFKVELTLMLS